jgi:hypothetical protein
MHTIHSNVLKKDILSKKTCIYRKLTSKIIKILKKTQKRQKFSQKPEKHEFIEKKPCRKRLCFW